MDLSRPNLKEDDEEALLRAQEEFLAKKDAKLSVHLDLSKRAEKRKSESTDQGPGACRGNFLSGEEQNCRPTKPEKDVAKMEVEPPAGTAVGELPAKKSKFARERQQGGPLGSQAPGIGDDVLQKHQKTFGSLQIIERDTSSVSVQRPQVSMQPFPKAERIDAAQLQGRKAGQRGQSLFAQMNRQLKKTAGTAVGENAMETGEPGAGAKVSGTSCIVTGSGLSASFGLEEARKIHMENTEKLASMAQEEILAEQQKLLQEIDPKLLEFLKSKRREPGVAAGEAKSEKQREKKSVRFQSTTKSSSNAMEEDSKVEVPFEVKGEWLHMDKVEKDKLAWMKDLPPPSAHVSERSQARFDFQGNVMPADQDVPVNLGLHHHGEEPERAGYTLQELFTLARSANVQQRTLSLNTLARILARAKEGGYRDLLQTAVLPSVTSAGLVFLLRLALDDGVDSVQAAALAALASFLGSPGDEACLDHTFGWLHGHMAPTLCPAPVPDTEEEEADKPVETDATVAERDVVFALVNRMSLLQRLLYIMKHRSPPAPTVLSCLAILTRVARHSPAMAYEIMHCPGLMDFIFHNFLPLSWKPVEPDSPVSSAHGLPLPAAMRLASAVCQAGRNMAAILVDRFKLGDRILQYLSAEPEKLQLKAGEAILLQTESYRTWTICLGYGLTSSIYSRLYARVVGELRGMRSAVPCLQPDPSLLQCQVAMVTALDMAVHVAASAKPHTGLQAGDAGQQGESVALTWQAVEQLAQQVQGLTLALLTDLARNHQHQKRNLQLLTACVKFMGSFYGRINSQAAYDPVRVLPQVEALFNDIIKMSWKNLGFRSLVLSLSENSNLLSPPACRNQELAASTGGLGGSAPGSGCLLPVLRCRSPCSLLSALLRLLLQLSRLHKGILSPVQRLLLDDADLLSYMMKVAKNKPSPLHDNFFTLHENLLQFYFLQICALKLSEEITGLCYMHPLCLLLLQRLPQGLAHLARILLSTLAFSRDFIECDMKLVASTKSMSELSLNSGAGAEEMQLPSNTQLLHQAIDSLPSIRTAYLTSLSTLLSAADKSMHQLEQGVGEVETLVMAGAGAALLPRDWVFLPLVHLYASSLAPTEGQDSKPSGQVVKAVLQWAFLLELRGSSAFTTLPPLLKLTRLLCTFLAGQDFFLDPAVRGLLWDLLCRLAQPRTLQTLDFMAPVPGISSFYDLYTSLLQQYQAVSYSDHVFCAYVLLPLMQRQSVQLRLALWGEHSAVLRSLTIPLSKLPVPLECFLEPVETDTELLALYLRFMLAPSTCRLVKGPPCWPVLVAVHHLNHFLYLQTDDGATSKSFRDDFWRQLMQGPGSKEKNSIAAVVTYYKSFNLNLVETCGLECYDVLPQNRYQTMSEMNKLYH